MQACWTHITCENYWVLGERSALLNSDLPLGWLRTMPQVAQSRRDPMAQCHSISECQTQSYCPDCVSRSISLADKADAYKSIILVKEVKEISIDRLFVFTLNSYKTESNLELALKGKHIRDLHRGNRPDGPDLPPGGWPCAGRDESGKFLRCQIGSKLHVYSEHLFGNMAYDWKARLV